MPLVTSITQGVGEARDRKLIRTAPPPTPCPYEVGKELVIKIHSLNSYGEDVSRSVTIAKVYPFSKSQVMYITGPGFRCILKLYDPRFLPSLRKEPYHDGKRKEYEDYLKYNGELDLLTMGGDLFRPRHFSSAKMEAYCRAFAKYSFETEVRVYDKLKDLQGIAIPELKGTVVCKGEDTYGVRGIILSYIDHTELKGINNAIRLKRLGPDMVHSICNQAVHLINLIGEKEVINYDAGVHNMIICKEDDRVMMIDFAECRIRYGGGGTGLDGYDNWRAQKRELDEEGRIGHALTNLTCGRWTFRPSFPYGGFDY